MPTPETAQRFQKSGPESLKFKVKPTCKPLPIMRLTALLPPPPTPTTFILADSMGMNEQLTALEHGRLRFPALLLREEKLAFEIGREGALR